MVSNKKRLYIALYPSGVTNNEERKYHWGFLIGPKVEKVDPLAGMRYHVKNNPRDGWGYEEVPLRNVRNTINLLARIVIAKVEDEERLVNILRQVPVVQNDPNWRCRTWVAAALAELEKDGQAVGTSVLDWSKIETFAREYVREKTGSGRYATTEALQAPKPTWNMLEDKEDVP